MTIQSITLAQLKDTLSSHAAFPGKADWEIRMRSALAARLVDGVRVVESRLTESGAVYDWTQCADEARDGDVFLFDNGTRAGILIECWPTIVVGNAGKLHTLAAPHRWSTYAGGKYAAAAAVARKLARPSRR
ncbi:hypothetical protein LJR296_007950 [Cupriavidus necator]|uniref:hypothetical protein n=1 Tax=Cupriavidus necator TaxID=106590 RepID=UPI003ECFC749